MEESLSRGLTTPEFLEVAKLSQKIKEEKTLSVERICEIAHSMDIFSPNLIYTAMSIFSLDCLFPDLKMPSVSTHEKDD